MSSTLQQRVFVLTICCLLQVTAAQVRVECDHECPCVFAGEKQPVPVRVQNLADTNVSIQAHLRLLQAGTSTVAPVAEWTWKKFELLRGQITIETVPVSFPPVKAETRFLIQWLEGTNRILGTTEVWVYPTNLLAEFKTLAGDAPLGLFDPDGQLKPMLNAVAVEFQDLLEDGTDKFHGKLAIFGPFDSKKQMRAGLADDIRALAKRGVAVVWLQPPPERHALLRPSFYTVTPGTGTIILAQHELTANLQGRPQAQLNLLRLAEVALRPQPSDLPDRETSNSN